ncbi:transposase [Paenibacillus plantiphilus]|uniref:transposase n=1 Tax=Paenibacillus plantiphilus TaxID=2905650 RepID=UPI001F2EE218|nr:transposase [Paenibacillus plantiphilus]
MIFLKPSLEKPRFRKLMHGECAGAPILRTLWDRFDFSLLLTQSGIFKRSGAPAWMLCFMYVVGLISGCTAVNQISQLAGKDALLELMFKTYKLAQYTLSRFFTTPYAWRSFGKKRVRRLQRDPDTMLREGDVINLDDTHCAHPYAKKLPYLSWLFDASTKTFGWCMNVVVLQAVLRNGLEYPLFYSVWRKHEQDGVGLTKLDLARQMLLMLRESVTCRLWMAMDRWYLCKDFFVFLQAHNFDWVTKAKRNTSLYRKVTEAGRWERYVPVSPRQLIREAYKRLVAGSGLSAIAMEGIYMKLPYETHGRKGQVVTKQRLVPIAVVAAMRLREDTNAATEGAGDEDAAAYKGAYLILSNRHDAPLEALTVYGKRWRIEVFFRIAKQELGFEQCHSTSEAHQLAHLEMLFAAETLLAYALWQVNKEKTSDESCTHGEMVSGLFHTRCQVRSRNHKGSERIYIDFDTEALRFSSLISAYWPRDLGMTWWPVYSSIDSHHYRLIS